MTGELERAAAMPAPQGGALPTTLEWSALERMANMLADSNLIPYTLKKKPGDIAVVLLAAREYGIPPLMALSKLPVVNGTPAPMGELMVALVLRAGHRITVDLHDPDGSPFSGTFTPDTYAACTSRRAGEDADNVLRFTMGEAVNAGLVELVSGKPRARDTKGRPTPWEQYTPNMLRWRAVANACRLRFPDVLLGLSYLPEELGANVDAEGRPVDLGDAEVTRPAAQAGPTLEERTAIEWLDKLDEQPWADEVLANVAAQAEQGGFIDVEVMRANGRTTVRQALVDHKARRDDVVKATANTPTPAEAPTPAPVEPPQETPPVAQEPEQAPAPADPPAEAPEPVSEPQEPASGITAEDLAISALEERNVDALQVVWQDTKRLDLVDADVTAYLTDRDRAVLGVPDDTTVVKLGTLVFEAVRYVNAQGAAVRDLQDADPSDPDDPWASDTIPAGEQPPAG